MNEIVMSNYKKPELEPQTLEVPATMAYGMELSARERVMANTVSWVSTLMR